MEKSEYSFGAYRYFIVPNDQISLFDAIDEKRKKAVQNFFSALVEEKKRSWEIKGRKHLLVFNRQVSSSVFICKFSMETKKTIFIESESDIEITLNDNISTAYLRKKFRINLAVHLLSAFVSPEAVETIIR